MPAHRVPTLLPLWLFTLVLVLGLLWPVQAGAAVLPDGSYLIQMSDSDMTVDAASKAMRAKVILWPYKPSARWHFQHLGNDIYKISSGDMVLDSFESIKKVGVAMIIFPWHGSGNQRWKVKRIGRHYSLINVTTGLAMELKGNNRVSTTPFHGNAPNGSPGQLFKLVDRQGQTPPAPTPSPAETPASAPAPQAQPNPSSDDGPYAGY